jgi:hypothetical protein
MKSGAFFADSSSMDHNKNGISAFSCCCCWMHIYPLFMGAFFQNVSAQLIKAFFYFQHLLLKPKKTFAV